MLGIAFQRQFSQDFAHYRREFEAVARKTRPEHHGRAFGMDVQDEVLIRRQRIHADGVFAQLWLQRGKVSREKVEDAGLIVFSSMRD